MSNDKVFIKEASIGDDDTLTFLLEVANEDRRKKHIWNLSSNSLVWENLHSFHAYLKSDFGVYRLYIAYLGKTKLGIFGMLNLDDCAGCANIIIWIDRAIRKKTLLIRWWLLFLIEAQNSNVLHFYAKIKLSNTVSLNSSKRYGFKQCDIMPRHLTATNQNEKHVCCVTRNTQFNKFEYRYIGRYMTEISDKIA